MAHVEIVDPICFVNMVPSFDWPLFLLLRTDRLFTLPSLAISRASQNRPKI